MDNELTPIADGVWTKSAPLRFYGVPLGTRMTVVRIGDGLVLHSPIAIDETTKAAIDALGAVRFVVAPNAFHHRAAGPAKALWPEARLVAARALRTKRPDLPIDADLEDASFEEWSGILTVHPVRGTMLGESVLHHTPTRTLVTSDLIENFRSSDDFVLRTYLRAGGIYGKPGWHRLFRFVYRDRAEARADVEKLLELDLERIVVAHGDLVEAGGSSAKDILREAMDFLWS